MMQRKLTNILGVVAVSSSLASAGTILRMDSPGENGMGDVNTTIPEAFASKIKEASLPVIEISKGGTPDITLAWQVVPRLSTGTKWEFHKWVNAGGGALQLNGSRGGASGEAHEVSDLFQITFTPSSKVSATVGSFNFTGDTQGDSYQYGWRVLRVDTGKVLKEGETVKWSVKIGEKFNGAPGVDVSTVGPIGVPIRLELFQSVGSVGNPINIAIDNLSFGQQEKAAEQPALITIGGISVKTNLKNKD